MTVYFEGTLAECKEIIKQHPEAYIKKRSHLVCTIDWLKEEFVLTAGMSACSPEIYRELPRTSIKGFEEDTDWIVMETNWEDY